MRLIVFAKRVLLLRFSLSARYVIDWLAQAEPKQNHHRGCNYADALLGWAVGEGLSRDGLDESRRKTAPTIYAMPRGLPEGL